MDNKDFLKRIYQLENELQDIRQQLDPDAIKRSSFSKVKQFGIFLISYWALLSFLIAILTAVYVKYSFDIDFSVLSKSPAISQGL